MSSAVLEPTRFEFRVVLVDFSRVSLNLRRLLAFATLRVGVRAVITAVREDGRAADAPGEREQEEQLGEVNQLRTEKTQ